MTCANNELHELGCRMVSDLLEIEIIAFLYNIIKVNNIIASKKDIEIVFDYEDIPEISIDASKIQQIINNLLSNAIKFTYNNKKIFVSLSIKDENLIIAIEDQGQGIPDIELSKFIISLPLSSNKASDNLTYYKN